AIRVFHVTGVPTCALPISVYSPTCNWPVSSPGCGVNRELYRVDGTVNAIDRDVVSAAAFGTKEDQWFAAGYVLRRETNEVRWIKIGRAAGRGRVEAWREAG